MDTKAPYHPELIAEVEAFVERHGMTEATFGRLALNGDWRLMQDLRGIDRDRQRLLRPETQDKLREFMAERDAAKEAA